MHTHCNTEQLRFSGVERRRVVAAFDGETISSDVGALLLGRADAVIGPIDRVVSCFTDGRATGAIEHTVRTLVGQRFHDQRADLYGEAGGCFQAPRKKTEAEVTRQIRALGMAFAQRHLAAAARCQWYGADADRERLRQ